MLMGNGSMCVWPARADDHAAFSPPGNFDPGTNSAGRRPGSVGRARSAPRADHAPADPRGSAAAKAAWQECRAKGTVCAERTRAAPWGGGSAKSCPPASAGNRGSRSGRRARSLFHGIGEFAIDPLVKIPIPRIEVTARLQIVKQRPHNLIGEAFVEVLCSSSVRKRGVLVGIVPARLFQDLADLRRISFPPSLPRCRRGP